MNAINWTQDSDELWNNRQLHMHGRDYPHSEEYKPLAVGTKVRKETGDYVYEGIVVSRFTKQSGKLRYVVEDSRGLLFIFSHDQLTIV